MACSICCQVAESLNHFEISLASGAEEPFEGPRDFSLGAVLELEWRASECQSCRTILAAITPIKLRNSLSTAESAHSAHLAAEAAVTAHLSSSPPRMFILAGDIEGVSSGDFDKRRASIYKLSYTPCHSTERLTAKEQRGRECDANTINVELIKRWIHRCDTAHHTTCIRKYDLHLLPTATLSFIDVEDLYIVTPTSEVRYAALSYVWGVVPVLRAFTSNIAELRKPGAFSLSQYRLPHTISDALTLCSHLGIRYLWVDSVCIVQDDPEMREEQLLAMATVYGKAYLTIAALQSEHADAGISRIGPTKHHHAQQHVIRLPSRSMIVPSSPPAIGLGAFTGTKWDTRGWTLQENVFSRRILALNNLATWVCFGDQWTEDVEFATEPDGIASPAVTFNQFKLSPVTWPSIRAFADLASEYAKRDLTYSSDTVNAFSGILTPMNAWFPGGLLYGTPEFTFDAGFLWNPRRKGARLRGEPNASSFTESSIVFPTWSWISWTGSLQFDLWNRSEDYIFPRGSLLLKPLVAWQKRLVETGQWVNVDNTYHVVRSHFRTDKIPPPSTPDGWIKNQDAIIGEVYYQHERHNHIVPWPRFSYPIPPFVRPRDYDRKHYYPYLRFRGELARSRLSLSPSQRSKLLVELQEHGQTSDVDMVTPDGDWIGRLRLNLQKGDTVPSPKDSVDLIAISEAVLDLRKETHARYVFNEVNNREELAELEVYEMVNVLWIGWCNSNMVYRQALGRVWKPAWSRLVVEDVELMLT